MGGALKGGHGAALALVEPLGLVKDGWNGFNVIHMAASRMGGLMLGYAQAGGIADVMGAKLGFFLGADEVDFARFAGFKVFVGHHGDKGAAAADVILPGVTYAEKSGTWVNLEGRVQRGERAVFAPGDARDDWTIFRRAVRRDRRTAAVRQPGGVARGNVFSGAGASAPGIGGVRMVPRRHRRHRARA